MDGDAAFLFMGSYDSLVHAGTVHTFTTELGKEGRMNIYYFIRIIMQNGIRYFQEEACQYNKVNMILVQYFQCFPVGKILGGVDKSRNSQSFSSLEYTGLCFVDDNQCYFSCSFL